jgi:putative ABC transport system permease protein
MAAARSIWKIAFRNLSAQNTTTILTVAAIAVCVMTFVSIFSILDGLQLTIESVMNKSYQRNAFVITSAGTTLFQDSAIPRSVAAQYRQIPEVYALSEEDLVIAAYEGVMVLLTGVDMGDLQALHTFQGVGDTVTIKPGECLVGETFSGTVGTQTGMNLSIETEEGEFDLRVGGVFRTGTPLDAQILVDRAYLSTRIPRFAANSSILRIRVLDPADILAIADLTRSTHPELSIREGKQVSKFFEKSIINVSRLLSTIIVFVILLMVLGIYNSMNMVVSERKWEIGIVRAMGARRSFILRLFILESAMLSVLGGLFGTALGIASSHAITSFFSILVAGSSSVVPLTRISTIGWAMTASLAIGLLGGMLPASRASRVEVSEALSEG